jgi:hypothetical protein
MPIQPIAESESFTAERVARQIVTQIITTAERIRKVRAEGVPAIEPRPAQTLPDGRVIPGRDGSPAVPPEAIDAALGAENVAILEALDAALQ